MSPSRRQLLRSGALSLSALAGCSSSVGTPTTDSTPTPTTTRRTTTTNPTEPEETQSQPPLRCGLGSLPEAGWPLPERSLGRTNYAPDSAEPTKQPTPAWSITASDPEVGDVHFTRPIVADGRVFVGRQVLVGPNQLPPDEHHVQAHDAGTGELLWRVPISGKPYAPSVTESAILVHDDEGTLYALDTASGAEKWTADLSLSVDSILPTTDGIFVVAHGDGTDEEVAVLLDSDGQELWRVPVPLTMLGSNLAWAYHRAYLPTRDARVVAIDTTEGTVAWTKNLQDGDDTAPIRFAATPCVVFAAIDGVLYAVRRTGTLAWTVDAGIREMATDGETIYGLDGQGYVSAFGVADGERRWQGFFGIEDRLHTDGFYDNPALGAETLFAGTLDGKLLAVSTEDGSERWTVERKWPDEALVSVVGDTLYTAWGRHLVAFR